MKTAAFLRRFVAVRQRRRAMLGVASPSHWPPASAAISAAAAAAASSSSSSTTATTSSRRRMGRPKNYRLNPLLDKLDLAEDDDDDDGDDDDDEGDDESYDDERDDDESASSSSSSASSSSSSSRQQQRPLRGSLLATQTLRAVRRSPAEIESRPSRFPLSGEFVFESSKGKGVGGGGKDDGGGGGSSGTFSLSSAQVIRALSPFLSEERVERIAAVASRRCFSVLPIVEGLFDRGNLGAVCRTAEAMGVGAVWAADLSSDRFRASRGRCSAGSERWIDIQVFSSSSNSSSSSAESEPDSSGTLACLRAAREAGFRVVVAAAGPGAVPADEFDWERSPTAFVVGNEARGVSGVAREHCDGLVMVPMVGMVESLNVSVASACLMQAALGRIKREGGMKHLSSSPQTSSSPSSSSSSSSSPSFFLEEDEVEALTAAMLLRHKGQQGKVGQQWQAPMFRELVARAAADGGKDAL